MIRFFKLIFIIFSISISSLEEGYSSSQNKFSLLVHKTPTCGCCKKWINHLEANSFSTMIKDHQNLQKVKEQHSIKPKYQSCHTAVSQDGYVFEGHIPSKFIKQFLATLKQMPLVLLFLACRLGHQEWRLKEDLCPMMFLFSIKMVQVKSMQR